MKTKQEPAKLALEVAKEVKDKEPFEAITIIIKSFYDSIIEDKDNESIIPLTVFSFKDGKEVQTMTCPSYMSENRQAFMHALGQTYKEFKIDIDEIVVASEVYYTKVDAKELGEIVRPSLSPDRKEAVMIVSKTINGEKKMKFYELIRIGDKVKLINSESFKEADGLDSPLLDSFWQGYSSTPRVKVDDDKIAKV